MGIIKYRLKPKTTKKFLEEKYSFITVSFRWGYDYYFCKATLNIDCKYGKKGKVIAFCYGTLAELEEMIQNYIKKCDSGK